MGKKGTRMIITAMVFGLLCATPQMKAWAAENSNTIKMVDYGDGFVLPEKFDLTDASGNMALLDKFDPAWLCVEYDGTPVTIDLGNGYTATRKYFFQDNYDIGLKIDKYVITMVYDTNGNLSYAIGRDGNGTAFSCMIGENGDYAYDFFSEPNLISNDEGKLVPGALEGELGDKISGNTTFLAYTNSDENGLWQSLSRIEGFQKEQITKEYVPMFDGMRLKEKVEYNTEKGTKHTNYNLVKPSREGLAEDDGYYEEFAFYEDDYQFITLESTHVLNDMSGEVHPGTVVQLTPSVKYRNGEAYYLFVFENREPSDYIDPSNGVLYKNQKDQTVGYFTKEQIEIIKAEGLKSSEEIWNAHSDFWGNMELIVDEEEEEVVSYEEEKKSEIVDGTQRDIESEGEKKFTTAMGGSSQKIVGDLVPINGKMPAYAMTRTMVNGSIRVDILDESGETIAVGGAFDMEHTKSKYVYFEFLDLLGNGTVIFEVVGTNDANMGGNLGGVGTGTTDTENGPTSVDSYFKTYGEDNYSYEGDYGYEENYGYEEDYSYEE